MPIRSSNSLRAGRSGYRIYAGSYFPHPSIPALELAQPSVQWVQGLFRGGKEARRCRWSPAPVYGKVTRKNIIFMACSIMACLKMTEKSNSIAKKFCEQLLPPIVSSDRCVFLPATKNCSYKTLAMAVVLFF